MEVPFGSLPDTVLGSILGAFGVPLGSLGRSNWGKRSVSKWIEKMMPKKVTQDIWPAAGNGLARP